MPNTIADNLQALNTARLNIADAITNKGGTVNTDKRFSLFPNDINTIPTANLTTLNVTENGTYYESTPTEITSTSFSITIDDCLGTNLLDYLISGNMSQSGTPTPTTPIQPQETGERTGNLFDGSIESGGWSGSDGQVPLKLPNGTRLRIDNIFKIDAQKDYTITVFPTTLQVAVMLLDDENKRITDTGWSESNYQNISNAHGIAITIRKSNNTGIIVNDCEGVMISEGSTALPYEPYGIKIPISSANTTTPVYLGEVQTTRRIKKLVLTGEEPITEYTGYGAQHCFFVTVSIESPGISLCSHYNYTDRLNMFIANNNSFMVTNNTVRIHDNNYDTEEELSEFLVAQYAAGTPVCVWYVLATPETAVVNEPLRKIGDYADTLSMEQAGVQIPTNRGNTVIDVMTELKPSEMYIKYDQPSEYAGYNIVNVNVPIPAYINTTIEAVNDSLLESLEGN